MRQMAINLVVLLLVMGLWGTVFASSPNEANKLTKQGREAFRQGRSEEALRYFEGALKINRGLNNSEGVAQNLRDIGAVYSRFSQYNEAIKYYEAALEIHRKLNKPQEMAIDFSQIGWSYFDWGAKRRALTCFQEGLKIGRDQKIPEGVALNLRGIGSIRRLYSRYDEAIKSFEEALEINRELKKHREMALTLGDMGLVYLDLGRFEESIKYLEDGLELSREQKRLGMQASFLSRTGDVYRALGRYDDALKRYEEALKINKEIKSNAGISRNLEKIGWACLDLKDYGKAEDFFINAEGGKQNILKESPGGKKNPRSHRSPGLIETYIIMQEYKEALKLLDENPPKWASNSLFQTRYHTQKGFALKGLGQLKDASGEFLEAVALIEESRQRVEEDTVGFFEARGRLRAYQGLVATLAERSIKGERNDSRFAPYGKDLSSASFYFSESTKARTLLEEVVRAGKGKQRAEIPENLRKKLQNVTDRLEEIDVNLEEAIVKDKRTFKSFEEEKRRYTSDLNDLVKELRERYPRYALLYYPKPLPPENLPLRDDEILLEYSLGEEASYLFVVRKGGVKKIVKIPFAKEIIEGKIRSFMEPLETRQYSFSIKRAKELYDILLADALAEAKENERIIVVNEGILGLLPFDALVMREGDKLADSVYVGDKFVLSYYQSATVLAFIRSMQAGKAGKVLFALGNPIFNKEDPRYLAWKSGSKEQFPAAGLNQYSFRALTAGSGSEDMGKNLRSQEIEFRPLPETEKEVVKISRTMGVDLVAPDVLLSVKANETELKKVKLDNYRYLHFATHADLPGNVQGIYEPFILLGQVENIEGDDGFLTLSEVLDLTLNADMVVLSACLTGRGKVMQGEGVINFSRAFQYAGAQSVVVSLWEVASNEAVEYMTTFYGHLKAGKGRVEALRLARQEIKAKYPNPFFWAVFVLHGEG